MAGEDDRIEVLLSGIGTNPDPRLFPAKTTHRGCEPLPRRRKGCKNGRKVG